MLDRPLHARWRRHPAAASVAAALLAILLGCACWRAEAPPQADELSLRHPPAGDVVGFTGAYGSHVFAGIPYAQAPVGALRWRAPRPLEPWASRREALHAGAPCAQLASPFAGVVDQEPGSFAGDEDCLGLDVYAPRMAPDELPSGDGLLPVMVWIHGGGNVVGHAGFYDGGNLAQSQQVVVVAIQYRLGPLGFLRHQALREEGTSALEASGNFGLLDQIRALEWVRENIAAFGGDPDNVTIFGESAGARDVLALVLSDRARGLFQRAIAQSGAARFAPADEAEALADAPEPGHPNSSNEILLRALQRNGAAQGREAAKATLAAMPFAEVAALLRSLSAAQLLALYTTEASEGLIDVPNVFHDGVVLPAAPPLATLADPSVRGRVPIILGTNRDEMKVFLYPNPEYVTKRFWILPRLRDPERYEAVSAIQTAAWKVVGADAPADALLEGGFRDVFVYRWDWDEEPTLLGSDLAQMIGAAHGFEIPFVFGHWYLGPEAEVVWTHHNLPGRTALAAAMMSYWAEFARTGDPARGRGRDLPRWRRWGSRATGERMRMILDTPAGGGPRMQSGRTTADDVVALLDAQSEALGPQGLCEMAEALAGRFRGISSAADARVAACRRDAAGNREIARAAKE
jgi:para-nitrobenzyl esterase